MKIGEAIHHLPWDGSWFIAPWACRLRLRVLQRRLRRLLRPVRGTSFSCQQNQRWAPERCRYWRIELLQPNASTDTGRHRQGSRAARCRQFDVQNHERQPREIRQQIDHVSALRYDEFQSERRVEEILRQLPCLSRGYSRCTRNLESERGKNRGRRLGLRGGPSRRMARCDVTNARRIRGREGPPNGGSHRRFGSATV